MYRLAGLGSPHNTAYLLCHQLKAQVYLEGGFRYGSPAGTVDDPAR